MNLVNNLSSNTNKTSAIPANVLAALAQSLSSGQATDKAFADILSQNQPVEPQKNDAHANTDAGTQGALHANANSNQQADNSSQQATSQAQVSQVKTQGKTTAVTAGKSMHNPAKGADKSKDAVNNKSSNQATDNNQLAAQTTPVTDAQPNQATPAANAAAAPQSDNQSTNATQANTPSNDNADANTGDAAALAADLNMAVNQPAISLPQTPAAQAPATQPADASANGASGTDSNAATSANGNANDPQMMLLLMQLERLAAAAKSSMPADATANAAASVQDPAAALFTQTNTNGTQGKTDLKSLMAAIAKSNAADLLGNNNITDPSNNVNTALGTQSTQTPAVSTAPATQQPAPAQQAATDKWMNNNFANLFNATNNDLAGSNVPTPISVVANTGIAIGNNDGASLDADLHGQNQSGSRDIGANTALNNNLLTATSSAQGTNPYDFASELSAMRATKGGATGLPTPVEQVVLQLRNGLSKDGSSEMTIQLRPAELGRIDVKLSVSNDGKVQGTVTADNPATLNLLLKDVRGLERALQDAGLRADSGSLQFNLRGDGQSGGSYSQANNSSGVTNGSQDASTQLPVFADAAETYYLTPGGVNMRV